MGGRSILDRIIRIKLPRFRPVWKRTRSALWTLCLLSLSSFVLLLFLQPSPLQDHDWEDFSHLPQQRRIRETELTLSNVRGSGIGGVGSEAKPPDEQQHYESYEGQSAYERSRIRVRRSKESDHESERRVFVKDYSLPFLETLPDVVHQPISPPGIKKSRSKELHKDQVIKDIAFSENERGPKGDYINSLVRGKVVENRPPDDKIPQNLLTEGRNYVNPHSEENYPRKLPKVKSTNKPLHFPRKEDSQVVLQDRNGDPSSTGIVKRNGGFPRNNSLIQKRNEKLYLTQLHSTGMIESLPSGGERLVASVGRSIRFPSSVKNLRPKDWEKSYRIYFNLTYYPWQNDPLCSSFFTQFAPPDSLEPMAIASFPSSGNTWLRYLVESSSGIFTGSMYQDYTITRKGMYGEGVIFDSGMTIAQKTHGYTTGDYMHLPHSQRVKHNHMEELNNKGIIIIRNPFKALISHRHLDVGGHTGYAPSSHFLGKGWKDFVLLKIRLWKEFYIDWLEAARPQDLHVVFYEELRSNILDVTEGILRFLHLPRDKRRLDCVNKYFDGNFKRKPPKTLPMGNDPYTRELKKALYAAIEDLNHVLKEKGDRTLPIHLYEMYNGTVAEQLRIERNWSRSSL